MIYLLLINAALFFGCYLAGCIPIFLKIPTSKIRLVSLFGAGLLLGAALVIVIPEGIETIYRSSVEFSKDRLNEINQNVKESALNGNNVVKENNDLPFVNNLKPHLSSKTEIKFFHSTHQQIGLFLLLGYFFMLIIDQLSFSLLESNYIRSFFTYLRQLCRCKFSSTSSDLLTVSSNNINTSSHMVKGFTVTCGLVIHSLADGLAIGSAFALGLIRLELIIFFAIILHKVPAAFGLTCFLLHQGFSRNQIRLHLFAFASAAPIGAFITYLYLTVPLFGNTVDLDSSSYHSSVRTGLALLLSGGTFLYVSATHILPELINSSGSHLQNGTLTPTSETEMRSRLPGYTMYTVASQEPIIGYDNSENGHLQTLYKPQRLGVIEIIVLGLGTLLPLLLSATHSH